jgi:hypothetical protein
MNRLAVTELYIAFGMMAERYLWAFKKLFLLLLSAKTFSVAWSREA